MEEKNEDGVNTSATRWSEVIIVIFLLVVLWVLLLPSGGNRRPNKKIKAMIEIISIKAAIEQYLDVYGGLPISTNIDSNSTDDFTFGTFNTSTSNIGITNPAGYQANNSEIIAIVMDMTRFPNGRETVNFNHSKNTKSITFLSAGQAKDTNSPGIGPDGVLRDPWGNPYIITIDLNKDGKCRDTIYRFASVSEAVPGEQVGIGKIQRARPGPYDSPATRDTFEVNASVMVWSLGPDGKADQSTKADQGPNKDNVVSW